jgi:ABC-type transporter Mla subunit MlaD
MPFGLEMVILEDWKEALRELGLRGLVVSYEHCLQGMHLSQKNDQKREERKTMVNNVTLNFSNGSSFTGPLAVGENIRISYDAATGASTNELQDRLRETVETVGKLVEKLESEEEKVDVSTQLKAFVEEARKEKPSRWMLNTTAKGLLDAATKIASMITPVSDAVSAVTQLINS